MLCLLTVDQKQCVNDSDHCLLQFQHNKKEFLRKYVTMDETWIYHFILESNWQSDAWTAAGESHPKQPKTQISAGRVLASVFCDVQGILCIGYLEKGRTINSKYYIALLVHLGGGEEEKKKKKKSHKWRKKCSFTKIMHHVISWSQW